MGDFEIVAVDNNSTDATRQVLSELARSEPRLRVIHQPVQGLSAARNGGIEDAQGQYIALLDADDLWDCDYLETHLDNIEKTKAGASYSRVRLIDADGVPTGQVTRPKLAGLTAVDLLRSNPCTSLLVVRRDVFDEAGLFDEDLRSVEDQEWLFRAAYAGVRLCGIARPIASYRITPGGLSADLDTMLASHAKLLEAAARVAPDLVYVNRRRARAAMLRYCARRAVDHNKGRPIARDYLLQMIETGPELIIREPVATLKTIARVLFPGRRRPAQQPTVLAAKQL
jgi:glycosyltransferase involved in cell wall biosynthesis